MLALGGDARRGYGTALAVELGAVGARLYNKETVAALGITVGILLSSKFLCNCGEVNVVSQKIVQPACCIDVVQDETFFVEPKSEG